MTGEPVEFDKAVDEFFDQLLGLYKEDRVSATEIEGMFPEDVKERARRNNDDFE